MNTWIKYIYDFFFFFVKNPTHINIHIKLTTIINR